MMPTDAHLWVLFNFWKAFTVAYFERQYAGI